MIIDYDPENDIESRIRIRSDEPLHLIAEQEEKKEEIQIEEAELIANSQDIVESLEKVLVVDDKESIEFIDTYHQNKSFTSFNQLQVARKAKFELCEEVELRNVGQQDEFPEHKTTSENLLILSKVIVQDLIKFNSQYKEYNVTSIIYQPNYKELQINIMLDDPSNMKCIKIGYDEESAAIIKQQQHIYDQIDKSFSLNKHYILEACEIGQLKFTKEFKNLLSKLKQNQIFEHINNKLNLPYIIVNEAHYDLYDMIGIYKKKKQGYFDENNIIYALYCINQAIQSLRNIGIAHGNINPSNVIYTRNTNEEKGYFKLANFLNCVDINHKVKQTRKFIIKEFEAPEIHQELNYDQSTSDVFSLGMCLISMITLDIPSNSTLINFDEILAQATSISDELKTLIKKMLVDDPSERITMYELGRAIKQLDGFKNLKNIRRTFHVKELELSFKNFNQWGYDTHWDTYFAKKSVNGMKSKDHPTKEDLLYDIIICIPSEKFEKFNDEGEIKQTKSMPLDKNESASYVTHIFNKNSTTNSSNILTHFLKNFDSLDMNDLLTIMLVLTPEIESILNQAIIFKDGEPEYGQNFNLNTHDYYRIVDYSHRIDGVLCRIPINDPDLKKYEIYLSLHEYNTPSKQYFPMVSMYNDEFIKIENQREVLSIFIFETSILASNYELEKYMKFLDEKWVYRMLLNLANALLILKNKLHIAHRNINLKSIQVSSGGNFILSHFNKYYQFDNKQFPHVLKIESKPVSQYEICYTAPEILDLANKEYDPYQADIYSTGVSLVQILKKQMVPVKNPQKVFETLKNEAKNNQLYYGLLCLIERMIDPNPKSRITIEKLVSELQVLKSKYTAEITKDTDIMSKYIPQLIQTDLIEEPDIDEELYGISSSSEESFDEEPIDFDDNKKKEEKKQKPNINELISKLDLTEVKFGSAYAISSGDKKKEKLYKIYSCLVPANIKHQYFQHMKLEEEKNFYLEEKNQTLEQAILEKVSTNSKYSVSDVKIALKHLAKALYFLQKESDIKMAHGNINLSTIQINNKGEYILCDFNQAHLFGSEKDILLPVPLSVSLDNEYKAPEMKEKEIRITKKYDPYLADIYALGICMVKMLQTSLDVVEDMTALIQKYIIESKEEFLDSLIWMIKTDPEDRINIEGLKIRLSL